MNVKLIVMGIAVFVLTLFVTTYGVNMFYSKPQYEDFCPNSILQVSELNEIVCFENGGKWIDGKEGYCNRDYVCGEAYELAQERYSMNIFLIAIPLGILILILGFYFFSLEAVGVGLMLGGIGTMLRGIGSYWKYSEDWIRFLISLIGLGIVIWFSYGLGDKFGGKKFSEKNKK